MTTAIESNKTFLNQYLEDIDCSSSMEVLTKEYVLKLIEESLDAVERIEEEQLSCHNKPVKVDLGRWGIEGERNCYACLAGVRFIHKYNHLLLDKNNLLCTSPGLNEHILDDFANREGFRQELGKLLEIDIPASASAQLRSLELQELNSKDIRTLKEALATILQHNRSSEF